MNTVTDIVTTLLTQRGVIGETEIEAFLNPSYERSIHDPYLLKDMKRGVERILLAIEREERIAIYSDFDADGIPGGVILHDFFQKIGYTNFTNYIPHRDTEGYGFHKDAVDTLHKDGVTLIITVDVGITAVETVAHAERMGMDCIITDHHEPLDIVPKAVAVIDPKQTDCGYPFDGLCGAGVAYKLVQALLLTQKFSHIPQGWEKWLLDLVAVATVADMMPLVDENRALVHWGLFVLRKSKRPGIIALCRKLRIDQRHLSEDEIGFLIAPRINASSRMGHPQDAFDLLSTDVAGRAEYLATVLEQLNNKRKGAVASIIKQAKKKLAYLQEQGPLPDIVVLGDPEWSPTIVGLASGNLSEQCDRTVCLWGREGTGILKGSCRTNGTVSIVDVFVANKERLLYYGGHAAAGGFAVDEVQVHSLQDSFNTTYPSLAHASMRVSSQADMYIPLSQAQQHTYREIVRLAPFGLGNPKPVFSFGAVKIVAHRLFGKEGNHLEIHIADERGLSRKATRFFANENSFTRVVESNITVEVLVTLEESNFNGRRSLELRIVDIV